MSVKRVRCCWLVLLCSVLCVVCLMCVDCRCAQTVFYKSCWIRRYPTRDVDVEESQRRGAHILNIYHEDTESQCSTSCCTTHNFSCSLAVFHYNTTQDSVNCFHLHCSSPDSCVLHHRRNVILFQVTKGVDPDLLVFGKHFTTNVRVLPHMSSSRLNVSEPLTSDKRHFNHPPNPPDRSTTKPSTTHQTSGDVSTSRENHLTPASPADERTTEINSRHALTTHVTDSTVTSTPSSTSTVQSTSVLTTEQQTFSSSGTLTTQQTLELQTTTQRNTKTTTSETTTSITERPPPVTSTTSESQTDMTDTHPPSISKSLTSINQQTATQTLVPLQTMTHVTNTTYETQTTVQFPTTTSQPSSTFTMSSTGRHVTLNSTRDPMIDSSSSSGQTSSRVDSQPYPNDTKGYIGRNISTDESTPPAADGALTSVWRLAVNTALVVLATCATIAIGCCCSVFAALRWRGRRRRKGRYRTDLRGQRGSMKLIKYVIVRESC